MDYRQVLQVPLPIMVVEVVVVDHLVPVASVEVVLVEALLLMVEQALQTPEVAAVAEVQIIVQDRGLAEQVAQVLLSFATQTHMQPPLLLQVAQQSQLPVVIESTSGPQSVQGQSRFN